MTTKTCTNGQVQIETVRQALHVAHFFHATTWQVRDSSPFPHGVRGPRLEQALLDWRPLCRCWARTVWGPACRRKVGFHPEVHPKIAGQDREDPPHPRTVSFTGGFGEFGKVARRSSHQCAGANASSTGATGRLGPRGRGSEVGSTGCRISRRHRWICHRFILEWQERAVLQR